MRRALRAETNKVHRIRKLTEVSRALTYAASLDEVFRLTAERAVDLLSAEKSLVLVANGDGVLALSASQGVDPTLTQRFHEPLNEMILPCLAKLLGVAVDRFLGVPLVVAGAVQGLLVVIRAAPWTSAAEDEWLLSALADQVALALEKNHLDEIAVFREQLMGIVGHDLRTPLATVLMAAEHLLMQEGLGEKATELARKITRSTTTAMRLIDQLLDLTRSRLGGGITLKPTIFDMEDVIGQVVVETELTHPDRLVQVDVRGDMTGVWDRDRIYQLLANLVGNAVKHGESRSPIALRIDAGETEIAIEVANRGIPIPPATLPFIFDAFRQGRSDPRRKGGLGLGLFIAQQIVHSHGGTIAVTSLEGEGTTFRVRMPRRAPETSADVVSRPE